MILPLYMKILMAKEHTPLNRMSFWALRPETCKVMCDRREESSWRIPRQ